MADALFDMQGTAPAPDERLSPGRRRTRRQAQAMAFGRHPLSLLGTPYLPLHRDAPPVDDRRAPGPRCGNCLFSDYNEHDFLKCTRGRTGEICTPSFRSGPYETHGAATDLRAWWPGCERWEPRDG